MKNWSDNEILDYLMTSDFDENFSPEELKTMLVKFRQFYRITANRFTNIEFEKKKFKFDLEKLEVNHQTKVDELNSSYEKLLSKHNSLLGRKLTFKERLFGRIIENNS
jgi:hypothetical protein